MAGTPVVELSDLLGCCEPCRTRTQRLLDAIGPEHAAIVRFCADPLLSVDLRDKRWAEKFDAAHPNRARR